MSFRNPPGADVRNPEKTTPYWIPDLGFASSGMTIVAISRFSWQPVRYYLQMMCTARCLLHSPNSHMYRPVYLFLIFRTTPSPSQVSHNDLDGISAVLVFVLLYRRPCSQVANKTIQVPSGLHLEQGCDRFLEWKRNGLVLIVNKLPFRGPKWSNHIGIKVVKHSINGKRYTEETVRPGGKHSSFFIKLFRLPHNTYQGRTSVVPAPPRSGLPSRRLSPFFRPEPQHR